MLKEQGQLLILAGQQNAPYVGYYQLLHAPNLKGGSMFFLRAHRGQSKRILGLNVATAYIPILMFYRPPFEGFLPLVSDMLSRDATLRLESFEDYIQYYVETLLLGKNKSHILYFAPVANKRIGDSFVESIKQVVKASVASRLTICLGRE